jgi:hypothetical protein
LPRWLAGLPRTREARGGKLCDVYQLRRVCGTYGRQRVAQHAVAERARRDDGCGPGRCQLGGSFMADPGAFLFSQEGQASAGATAESTVSRAAGFNEAA